MNDIARPRGAASTLSAYDRALTDFRRQFAKADSAGRQLVDEAMTDTLPADMPAPTMGEES